MSRPVDRRPLSGQPGVTQTVRQRERPVKPSVPISAVHPAAGAAAPTARVRPRAKTGPSSRTEQADYEVGYSRPPKHSRFQPGRSGNPRGRPKRATSPMAVLRAELLRKIRIRENGKLIYVTNLEAIIKRTVADTLSGKISPKLLLSMFEMLEHYQPQEVDEYKLSASDAELVAMLMKEVSDA